MSKPEPTSDVPEVQPDSVPEGDDVVMYMAANGPEECIEGYYWDGTQCVRKTES